jgi:hypothetical protein
MTKIEEKMKENERQRGKGKSRLENTRVKYMHMGLV